MAAVSGEDGTSMTANGAGRQCVSILMPVFNGGMYVGQAIDSVLRQTHEQWELVIVDDGSTDNTSDVIAGYSDARIRCVHQKNSGQTAALNRGLTLARGDYLTTLDADDWIPPDSLACRLMYLISNEDVGVAYGDGVYCHQGGDAIARFSERMPTGVSGDVFDTLVVSPFYGTGAAVMVRREVLERHQISYDESISWCQDWDIYIRLAAVTTFGFVDSPVVNYRIHDTAMTMTMPNRARWQSLIRLKNKVLAMERFGRVASAQKKAFFHEMLTKDLVGEAELLETLLGGVSFNSISRNDRAGLLRMAAIGWLHEGGEPETVARLLRKALIARPVDVKTLAVCLLIKINPALARSVTRRWQATHRDKGFGKSPFAVLCADAGGAGRSASDSVQVQEGG
jgi:glycosyltransferase involved in cell wall biosynthesis